MSKSPILEFNIGDRLRWTDARDWWNSTVEKIRAIEGDIDLLDYWGVAIQISNLILINSAPKLKPSPANKLQEFSKLGVASVNQEAAA